MVVCSINWANTFEIRSPEVISPIYFIPLGARIFGGSFTVIIRVSSIFSIIKAIIQHFISFSIKNFMLKNPTILIFKKRFT